MTTKTIKTILFASLIAAMILPFSGMNTAHAETLSLDEAYDLLNQYEKDLLFQTALDSDEEKKSDTDEKDKALKRIELGKQLIVTKQRLDNTEDSEKQEKLEQRIQDILKKIEQNRSNNVVEAQLELVDTSSMAFGYGTDWDTQPVEFNCATQNYFYAQNDGTEYSANPYEVRYWWDFKYPTEFDTGSIPCGEDYDYASAIIQSYNSNGWPVCTLTWPYNADATIGAICEGAFDNFVALVTTDGIYENDVNFRTEFSYILP